MGNFHGVDGWIFILLAAVGAARPLHALVSSSRSRARVSAIAAWVWSGLFLSLVFLANGVLALCYPGRTWQGWILVPLDIAGLVSVAVPGIASRKKASVAWWRFWARLPRPGPAIAADARPMGLTQQIDNVAFRTTRLSPGYDEEEVDAFLDKLATVLSEGGQPDQAELRNARFASTRLRPGYVMQDVDDFLHEIARAVKS